MLLGVFALVGIDLLFPLGNLVIPFLWILLGGLFNTFSRQDIFKERHIVIPTNRGDHRKGDQTYQRNSSELNWISLVSSATSMLTNGNFLLIILKSFAAHWFIFLGCFSFTCNALSKTSFSYVESWVSWHRNVFNSRLLKGGRKLLKSTCPNSCSEKRTTTQI